MCHDAVKNIYSAGMLRELGYGLHLLRVPRVVKLVDGMVVLTASYLEMVCRLWVLWSFLISLISTMGRHQRKSI